MSPALLLIVSGPPASGKTTLARRLAADLGLPLLEKDVFKEPLFDSLGTGDEAWSRRLSELAFAAQFAAARALLESGESLILEGNFRRGLHGPQITALAEQTGARLRQLACAAPAEVLAARQATRSHGGGRHPAHRDGDQRHSPGLYAPLEIERTLPVDTGAPLPQAAYQALLAGLREGGA